MEIMNERFEKIKSILSIFKQKKMKDRNFEALRPKLLRLVENCKTVDELNYLLKDLTVGINELRKLKQNDPENSKKVDEHIKWLKTEYVKAIKERKKEIQKQNLKEEAFSLESWF